MVETSSVPCSQMLPPRMLKVCKQLINVFSKIDPDCIVTMSIGLAEFIPDTRLDADSLIKRADSAMYSSNKQSEHYITVYSDESTKPKKEAFYPTN